MHQAATTNGNGAVPSGRLSFTLSQVIQLILMLAAGYAAFSNLKGDVREGFAKVGVRLDEHERRLTRTEDRVDRLRRSR